MCSILYYVLSHVHFTSLNKNMKINTISVISVRIRSVYFPTEDGCFRKSLGFLWCEGGVRCGAGNGGKQVKATPFSL